MSDMFCDDCRRTTSGRCARHLSFTWSSHAGEGAQETRCRVVHAPDCNGECEERILSLTPERAALVQRLTEVERFLKIMAGGADCDNWHSRAERLNELAAYVNEAAAALRGEAQPEEGR